MLLVGSYKTNISVFIDGMGSAHCLGYCPSLLYSLGTTKVRKADSKWHFIGIMVQHTFMAIPDDTNLRVGDMISFSTSHPCLTLDKWPNICIIDDHYHIEQVVSTYF